MDEKTISKLKKTKHLSEFAELLVQSGLPDGNEKSGFIKETLSRYEAYKESLPKTEDSPAFSPGQEILICGNIGLSGSVFLMDFYKEKLLKTLSSSYIKAAEELRKKALLYPSLDLFTDDAIAVYPVCERGLFREIYNLGKDSGLGFKINYFDVPISRATVEFCEIFDMDPWALLSGGCILIVTSCGRKTEQILKDNGFDAAVIGYITKEKTKLITYRDTEGGINRPSPDEILKLLQNS
ncbi:MAG: hypothetical protein K6G40_09120 [Eubacterium sp.]|nr:hypothetical protein [Eubacterium sp.]